MAYILATHPDPKIRDVKTAIQLAERASTITGYNNAMILNTLATTYTAAGEYDKAVEYAEKAITLATAEKDHALANYIRAQLALYQQAINSL
jgi:tetratricopeptide (TPR) repeat protein